MAALESLSGSGSADVGLQLNLLVLLGTLGEAAETTAQLVLDSGGLAQLLSMADPAANQQLQEAAVDGLVSDAGKGRGKLLTPRGMWVLELGLV